MGSTDGQQVLSGSELVFTDPNRVVLTRFVLDEPKLRPTVDFQLASQNDVGDFPWKVVVADFNGDHKADLAFNYAGISGSANSIGVLLGNGDGTFGPGPTLHRSPIFLAAG